VPAPSDLEAGVVSASSTFLPLFFLPPAAAAAANFETSPGVGSWADPLDPVPKRAVEAEEEAVAAIVFHADVAGGAGVSAGAGEIALDAGFDLSETASSACRRDVPDFSPSTLTVLGFSLLPEAFLPSFAEADPDPEAFVGPDDFFDLSFGPCPAASPLDAPVRSLPLGPADAYLASLPVDAEPPPVPALA
jgi:hypothetical protein